MKSCDDVNDASDCDSDQESATTLETASRLELPRVAVPATAMRRRASAQLASVVVAIVAITAYVQFGPSPADRGDVSAPPHAEPPPPVANGPGPAQGDKPPAFQANESLPETKSSGVASVAETPGPPATAPVSPPVPQLDRAKVALAESALDAASRDHARADERAAESASRLSRAANQAALDALRARKLGFQLRDPSTRIAQAVARGGFVRGERDKLATEVATLRSLPRPKSKSILSKSPVARPADDEEFHFELRRNRISYIDLSQLLEKTRADAQIRIRMSDRFGAIGAKVGPIGAFSLAYELVPAVPSNVEELVDRRTIRRFELKGWELIPESENRGETYEGTQNPISEFTRAVNRINSERATITLWVYPDSFALYRQIRNDLVDRGFSVAARPLPEGLAIRGSPMGTQSAAQ
jgi:hypothetical protein